MQDTWVGKMPWRKKWQPTPVFLPRKFYGQRSLVGYNPWGHKRAGHDLATKQQQNTKNFKATIIDKHNKLNLFSEI